MTDNAVTKLFVAVIALIVCVAFLASFFVMITQPDKEEGLFFGQVKLFDFENQTRPVFQPNESVYLNETNNTIYSG